MIKVNLGFYLEDDTYASVVKDFIRAEENKKVLAFRRANPKKVICPTCGGLGYVGPSGKKADFAKLAADNIIPETVNTVLPFVASFGRRYNSKSKDQIEKVYKQLMRTLAGLRALKKNSSTQWTSTIRHLSLKKCPDCLGHHVQEVDHIPSISTSILKKVKQEVESRYKEWKKTHTEEFNLYDQEIDLMEMYKTFKFKYKFISKRENLEKVSKDRYLQRKNNLRKQFKKYLNEEKVNKSKLHKSKDFLDLLVKESFDKLFARFIVSTLKKTVRVDTGTAKKKMRARIRKSPLRIYILSSKVSDIPGRKTSNIRNNNVKYIKFYSDWGDNTRATPWSKKKGIGSLKGYLYDKVQEDFLSRYHIMSIVKDTDKIQVTKKLLKLLVLFGESYGGK